MLHTARLKNPINPTLNVIEMKPIKTLLHSSHHSITMSPTKLHAVIVPYPLQGHVTPAAHLAIKLASRGLAVTFVNSDAIHRRAILAGNHDYHEEDPFAGARKSGLDIRYELLSSGLPVGFDRSVDHEEYMEAVLHDISSNVEGVLARLVSGNPTVSCLVADTFFGWPDRVAKKLGIPYVSFWTEPALVFSLYYHMELLIQHGHFASQENLKDTITYIPGVPSIEPTDLPSYLQATDTTSVVHQIIHTAFDEVKGAEFILGNTADELEHNTIAAIPRFYAIGPISTTTTTTIPTSLWAESKDCIHWLSTKPPGTILYVSFGSYAHISKPDLAEIARGVLDSGVSFLWAIRPDMVSSDEPDPLPTRFADTVRESGRGLVVPWCPQGEILSHGATGGFLTHCGWNSVMECVRSGVPMLCFPLLTDQFTNRRLVVREWRAGIDVGETGRADREMVKEGIVELMGGGDKGEMVRRGVEEVRKKLERAVGTAEGSSEKNLDRFIEDLQSRRL